MIASLGAGHVDEFLVAGGTMAHYVGDACEPLHISYLHHGADPSESAVHSDYETTLIDHKSEELFEGVDAIENKVKAGELVGPDGKDAARLVVKLMKTTVETLAPKNILRVWRHEKGHGKYDRMWEALGHGTIKNTAAGSHAMAVLWQSAWEHRGGNDLPAAKLKKVPQSRLQDLYTSRDFVGSL